MSTTQGNLQKVTTFDEEGRTLRTEALRNIAPGVEEAITSGPDGAKRESTITRRDPSGNVIDSTVTSDTAQIQLQMQYDDQGRPTSGLVTLGARDSVRESETNMSAEDIGKRVKWSMRIQVAYPTAGDHCVITLYGQDQTILGQVETNKGNIEHEASQMIFGRQDTHSTPTITRIGSRDLDGNWTSKTILEHNPVTQAVEPIAILYRTITY
jgi:YD repeat-containing protein